MKNKFNFKIVGSGPTGLLLSIALSKFDCNIFLTDLLTKDRLIDKDKTYAITHSTRKILSKFRLWEKLEPFLFGFDTLSISDSVTSAFTNLSTSDLDDDISSAENIGWVVKHSDIMNVFFQEIENYENIFLVLLDNKNRKIKLDEKVLNFKRSLQQAFANEISNSQIIDEDTFISLNAQFDVLYPSIGENMDFLDREFKDIDKLHFIGLKEDIYCWQFSKKGFFNFKKNIPEVINYLLHENDLFN